MGCKRGQQREVFLVILLIFHRVQHFNDADRPAMILQRDCEDCPGFKAGHLVDFGCESRIMFDVIDHQGLAVLHDPSGNALSRFQPDHL